MEKEQIGEGVEEIEQEPWYKGPIKYIIIVFLLLLIVLWYFPKESIKLDPEPVRIPLVEEVLPSDFRLGNESVEIKNKNDFYGTGKVVENKLLNFVPKSRRLRVVN